MDSEGVVMIAVPRLGFFVDKRAAQCPQLRCKRVHLLNCCDRLYFMYICMDKGLNVCMYVCMNDGMYACMYVFT